MTVATLNQKRKNTEVQHNTNVSFDLPEASHSPIRSLKTYDVNHSQAVWCPIGGRDGKQAKKENNTGHDFKAGK